MCLLAVVLYDFEGEKKAKVQKKFRFYRKKFQFVNRKFPLINIFTHISLLSHIHTLHYILVNSVQE